MKTQIQQGDVLLKKIKLLPEGAQPVKPDARGHVLAEGEATGHCHAIDETSDAELYRIGEALILANMKAVTIKHQEHKPIVLEPGIWEIGQVREWDYLKQMERKVVD